MQQSTSGLKEKKVLSDDGHLGSKSQTKKAKMSQKKQTTTRPTTSRPPSNTLIVAMEELGLTVAPTNVLPTNVASSSTGMNGHF